MTENVPAKPKTMRGLVLYTIQGICEVYEKDTFTNQEVFDELIKDRPKTTFHTFQTCISKDIAGTGMAERVGRTTPAVWKLTEKGKKADPFTFKSYDAILREKKKAKEDKDKKEPADDKGSAPAEDAVEDDEEMYAGIADLVDYIQYLKRKIGQWEYSFDDMERKLKKEIKEYREELQGKNKVIEKLNKTIIELRKKVKRDVVNPALKDEIEKWKKNQSRA